jgi:hypothetical protein
MPFEQGPYAFQRNSTGHEPGSCAFSKPKLILTFSGSFPAGKGQVQLPNGNIEFHSPQREAALFYGLFLRGHPVDSIREQIDVSPKLFQKWMRARDFDSDFREDLRRMYAYRKQVLAIFDALVTSERANRRWQ